MARCKQIARSAGPSKVPRLIPVITQSPAASRVPPVPSPVAAPPKPSPKRKKIQKPPPTKKARAPPPEKPTPEPSQLVGYLTKYTSIHQCFPAESLSPEWFEMVHQEYDRIHMWKQTTKKLANVTRQLDANPNLHTRPASAQQANPPHLVTKVMKLARKIKRRNLRAKASSLSKLVHRLEHSMLFTTPEQHKLFRYYLVAMEGYATMRECAGRAMQRELEEKARRLLQEGRKERRQRRMAQRLWLDETGSSDNASDN